MVLYLSLNLRSVPDRGEYQLEMVLNKLLMGGLPHHHAKAFVTKPLAMKQDTLILEFSLKSKATLPNLLGILQE